MRKYNFIAIDFETANQHSDSACAMAIVVVKDNVIFEKVHHLVKPPVNDFMFSYLHGITWQDVQFSPDFKKIWEIVSKYFYNIDFIAAHNAKFDKKVLYTCCKKENIPLPDPPFICTVEVARSAWNIFPTKLPAVCSALNIKLEHHNALSDAEACAEIVLRGLYSGVNITKFL